MTCGPDFSDLFKKAATYTDRILNGTRPAERPERFSFVLNQHVARSLGLTIPPGALQQADTVVG